MQVPKTLDDLIAKAESVKLYKNLLLQLNKDLAMANVDLHFNEQTSPLHLKIVLQKTIFHLLQNHYTDYLNLLYIIDVSENKVNALKKYDAEVLAEKITFLILQRQWQKVWYRNV